MLGSLATDAPYAAPSVRAPARTVSAGGCATSALPLDATCAGLARHVFRGAAAGVGLPADLVDDGVTMASELAANTLHAQAGIQVEGAQPNPVAGGPEIWLYLRRSGSGTQELVCKVFDSLPAWTDGALPEAATAHLNPVQLDLADLDLADLDAVSGRGLQVIDALSQGRWGHHLTRSRLGTWKVPGKAVWFALPVPPSSALDRFYGPQPGSCEAAVLLEQMLADRGISHIVRADAPASAMAVLSIRRDLTVWCRSRVVSWTTSHGREWRAFIDLVDAAERIVCAHEELARADADGSAVPPARAGGALLRK